MEESSESTAKPDGEAELRIPATAVSRGIGIGHAVFLKGDASKTLRHDIRPEDADGEIGRLREAIRTCRSELSQLAGSASTSSQAEIFSVQQLIIESPFFIESIESEIKQRLVNAAWAVDQVSHEMVKRQKDAFDPHIRETYVDLMDVAKRLLHALGDETEEIDSGSGAIYIVNELMPSLLLFLARRSPNGIISAHGGWTSHSSILARELRLPVVTGVRKIEEITLDGQQIILDGIAGEVIVRPSPDTLRYFSLVSSGPDMAFVASGIDDLRTVTKDGLEIVIRVNTETADIYREAKGLGARGVGLYRSEVLFDQSGCFPSEDEQFEAYSRIGSAAGETGVRIRTFDVGAGQIRDAAGIAERNPSLGMRSIRMSLTDQGYFRTQIRAILRSAHGPKIDIVLPMISGVNEIRRLRRIIEEERSVLDRAGIPIGDPRVGAMIEVPSAVLTADAIAENVDFVCLGTNDLVQYLLAVDRDNDAVADWYQSLHPAVIKAIRHVISAAEAAGKPLTTCGEIAGSPFYLPVLIGLGARELSISLNSIQPIRKLLLGITTPETEGLIEQIKNLQTPEEIESMLRTYYLANWRHLFPPNLLDVPHR